MPVSDINVWGNLMAKNEADNDGKVVINKTTIPTLPNGTYRIADGLYLRKRNGRSNFFFRVMVSRKRHDISIGPFPVVSITTAKAKAATYRSEIAAGGKPWAKSVNRNITFNDYWESALETYAGTRHWKRHEKVLRGMKYRITKYVLPHIGTIPVKEVSREDVLKIIGGMWSERPVLADDIRVAIEKVLGMAVTQELIASNPAVIAGNLEYFLPPKTKVMKVVHRASADFETTKKMLRHFQQEQYASWRCIVLLLLTARRLSEAVFSRWSDFDLDAGVWTIPNEVMKVDRGVDRRVPLPRQLCGIMKTWEHNGEFVFSPRGKKPILKHNPLKSLTAVFPGTTIHGFRATFTSWCADAGIDIEVAEACLDHASGGVVRQAYHRSDLLERRREVLQRYADALFEE